MNWNIFWGLYTLAFAVAALLVWYFLYYRKKNYTELCSIKTTGTIIRYSAVQYNDVSLPVAEYTANGHTYTVVGPKFSATVTKSFSSPFHRAKTDVASNLTTRENLPNVLKLNLKNNSVAGLTESPLLELYPIGSEVDVFYNPAKPKMAYVQRFVRPHKGLYTVILLIGVVLLATAFGILFGPTITMH